MNKGRSAKRKGSRVERWFANDARRKGIEGRRIPGSGAFEGLPGDNIIAGLQCETKARKEGFKLLERWIAGNDAVLLKPDYKPAMVVVWWEDWTDMLKELEYLREELEYLRELSRMSDKGAEEERLGGSKGGEDATGSTDAEPHGDRESRTGRVLHRRGVYRKASEKETE